MENENKSNAPRIMYIVAAVLAIGSYLVYAGSGQTDSFGYFEYFEYYYLGAAYLLWIAIVVLVIAGVIMSHSSKVGEQVAGSVNGNASSKANEIVKLKELLDSGALTAEEFEAEKKKILEK